MPVHSMPRPHAPDASSELGQPLVPLGPGPAGLSSVENPFPGLRPFGADEGHLFFGREEHTEALLGKLSIQRLIAVVGTSGSGKSSLVFAGILPRLRRGYRTRVHDGQGVVVRSSWRIAQMRPGDDPIGHLARALQVACQDEEALENAAAEPTEQRTAGLEGDEAELERSLLEAQLRRSQYGLVEACRGLQLSSEENLLLIVDQFEELFRFRALSQERGRLSDPATAFVQLLLRATEQVGIPIYVMLTMRSDFIGDCVQFTGLPEAINEGQYLLPLLNRDQRERVIRGPMAVSHAAIAPALVQRLLNDAGDMTDQLPVLQHALMRSFDLWRQEADPGDQLQLVHYQRSGAMANALSTHADEVLSEVRAELGERGVEVAEGLFRALTERSDAGRGVRRPCRVAEVLAVADTDLPTLARVVSRFSGPGRGFVVVQPVAAPLGPDSVMDISHEALMRLWGRLRGWCDRELELAQRLGELRDAEQRYADGEAGLWRDPELSRAADWMARARPTAAQAKRYGIDLDKVRAFLDASVVAQQQALQTERDARIVRRLRALFVGPRALLLLLPLLSVLVGSGLLDASLGINTRAKRLAVAARNTALPRGLHERLGVVVIDPRTNGRFRDEKRGMFRLGSMSARWRILQAEALKRMVDAGVRVVAFDVAFSEQANPSPLVFEGTQALAEAIAHARRRGTAVIFTATGQNDRGEPNTEPSLLRALQEPAPWGERYAPGRVASPCVGLEKEGWAVYQLLFSAHEGRPHRAGLPLAAFAASQATPSILVDRPDRTLLLGGGEGPARQVTFADSLPPRSTRSRCGLLGEGDEAFRQVVDLFPRELARGDPGVIPFEDLFEGPAVESLRGKVVIVGEQRGERDQHNVVRCTGTAPWSCASVASYGMSLHVEGASALLRQQGSRPARPLGQFLFIALMCITVAWQRMRHRDSSPRRRMGALLGLMAIDLAIVVVAAVSFGLLMDEVYHLLAMAVTHVVVGRLDRH